MDPIDALIDDINAMTLPAQPKSTAPSRSDRTTKPVAQEEEHEEDDEPIVDDLDAMILEIEGKKGVRRRKPTTNDGHDVGARKNPASRRKDVVTALDGDDLDRILDEIQNRSKEKARAGMDKLGWGVVNAERKIDLIAPRYILRNQDIKATIVVTSNQGEPAPLPREQLKVTLSGSKVPLAVADSRGDGTLWSIQFLPNDVPPDQTNIFLIVTTYGQEQFNWKIELCGNPMASKCSAVAQEVYKVNQRAEVTLIARDGNNQQLKVGGAKFSLSFAGSGQLNDVNLVDRMDGSYTLTFVPSTVGQYGLFVSLDGEDIADSPINFTVNK